MRGIALGSRILVTGGAGFIGSALTRRLVAEGFTVRVLDDLSRGRRERLADVECELIVADIRSERVAQEACADVAAVVHLAATAPVMSTGRDERIAHDVNVTGVLNLLAAAQRARVGCFVLGSSSAVYGGRAPYLLHEDVALQPATSEGVQKAAAEAYARLFHERDGLPTCALRFFSVYGPERGEGMIAQLGAAARAGEALTIRGDGTQTHDFLHIDDAVAALLLALTTPSAIGRTLNVASGEAVSVRHLVGLISELVGGLPAPRYVAAKPGRQHDVHASVAAAAATLGFRARIPLRVGLAEAIGVIPAPRRAPSAPPRRAASARPLMFPEGSETKIPAARSAPLFANRPPSWVIDEEAAISLQLDDLDEVMTPAGSSVGM